MVEPSLADVVVGFLLDAPMRKGCETYEEAVDRVVVVGNDECGDGMVLDELVPGPEIGQDLVSALVPVDEAASVVVYVLCRSNSIADRALSCYSILTAALWSLTLSSLCLIRFSASANLICARRACSALAFAAAAAATFCSMTAARARVFGAS